MIDKLEEYAIYLCSGILAALGGLDGDLKVLWYLTMIDCVTGVLRAVKDKKVLTKNMFIGFVVRKPSIYLAIAAMCQLEKASFIQEAGIQLKSPLLIACILMEFSSILENLKQTGVWLPKVVDDVLEVKRKYFKGE
ncbi:MAG: phage holin family protein [Fusobacteriaceae bacterium]